MSAEGPHRIAGLFAGIGGIEVGMERAGHQTSLLCENAPAANAVLDERFDGIARHEDVLQLEDLPSEISLLTAGFPCQDLSQVGQTRGIDGERSSLVLELFRLLKRRRVPWLLIENVPFMLQLGRGRAMSVIVDELESLGYRWAYRTVDARAFGLPQRRYRVFLLATIDGDPREVLFADDHPYIEPGEPESLCGFYWTEGTRGIGWAVDAIPTLKGGSGIGIPSAPAVVGDPNGIFTPSIEDAERLQGFPAGWTAPAATAVRPTMRWRLVGNAVAVPVAEWIGHRLARPGPSLDLPSQPIPQGSGWPKSAYGNRTDRFAIEASPWPVQHPLPSLDEFLVGYRKPLSAKATEGFLGRAVASSLHFEQGFIEAVERHLDSMREPIAGAG